MITSWSSPSIPRSLWGWCAGGWAEMNRVAWVPGGESRVSRDPQVQPATVTGPGVALALYDPEVVDACIKVCTENHFTFE
jgi:hypothetical protein